MNGNAESSESASTSSLGSNHSSHNKAPGAQLHHQKSIQNHLNHTTNNSNLLNSIQTSLNNTTNSFNDFKPDLAKQVDIYVPFTIFLCNLFLDKFHIIY